MIVLSFCGSRKQTLKQALCAAGLLLALALLFSFLIRQQKPLNVLAEDEQLPPAQAQMQVQEDGQTGAPDLSQGQSPEGAAEQEEAYPGEPVRVSTDPETASAAAPEEYWAEILQQVGE